ncbi:hypothetical protein [Taibaiella helva]|uniref:hypothetical protein n=1 Tax=Taibaiella helva TaxID=2301235 RepID=UPI00130063F4|nr:hypothetical protein [Taibaiella helva]
MKFDFDFIVRKDNRISKLTFTPSRGILLRNVFDTLTNKLVAGEMKNAVSHNGKQHRNSVNDQAGTGRRKKLPDGKQRYKRLDPFRASVFIAGRSAGLHHQT